MFHFQFYPVILAVEDHWTISNAQPFGYYIIPRIIQAKTPLLITHAAPRRKPPSTNHSRQQTMSEKSKIVVVGYVCLLEHPSWGLTANEIPLQRRSSRPNDGSPPLKARSFRGRRGKTHAGGLRHRVHLSNCGSKLPPVRHKTPPPPFSPSNPFAKAAQRISARHPRSRMGPYHFRRALQTNHPSPRSRHSLPRGDELRAGEGPAQRFGGVAFRIVEGEALVC